MTLRVAGDRTSFISGEPIRLNVDLIASRPGYVVDTVGLDEGSDAFDVTPELGVYQVPNKPWRDVLMYTKLSDTPTTLSLVANYSLRFDRAGDYTIAFRTGRVRASGHDDIPTGPFLELTSNPITLHIALPTEREEQRMVGDAMTALRNAPSSSFEDQIHAAEQFAFLPGDLAAVQKYRERERVCAANMANACGVVSRGFLMSWHPNLILQTVEADLADVSRTATSEMVRDAAELRLLAEDPEAYRRLPGLRVPFGDDAMSLREARYLQRIHESLPGRSGASKLQSALTVLTMSRGSVPPDVTALVLDGFSQFSSSEQQWLINSFWQKIRSPRLAPALLSLLPKVDRYQRMYVLRPLIDLSPETARDGVLNELRDPESRFGTEDSRQLLASFPDDAFREAGPALVATIRSSLESSKSFSEEYRAETKAALLPLVAGPDVLADVRSIYQRFGDRFKPQTKADFFAYFMKWDADKSAGAIDLALRSDPDGLTAMLSRIAETAYSPRLDVFVREQIAAPEVRDAAAAASILSKWGRTQDRALIEDRLEQWQASLRSRPSDRATEYDPYESQLVLALINSKHWTVTTADRDRLLASCVTLQCQNWLLAK